MSLSDADETYLAIELGLNKIGAPIVIILGTIGSELSVCIFAQKTMRQNPCSIYFIAINIANGLYLWLCLFPSFLSYTFGIDPTPYNLTYCRLKYYSEWILLVLGPSYLVLASIDRTLMTSREASIRNWSTHRVAYCSIGGVTLFCLLFYIHAFFKVNMVEWFPGFQYCTYDAGLYTTLMTWNAILLDGILPPTLMTIFALMTLRNIRLAKVVPINTAPIQGRIIQKKDRQLVILLLVEILVYTIFSLMNPSMLFYTLLTTNETKSLDQYFVEGFVETLALFLTYIPACVSFYCNVAISHSFRNKVKDVLGKIIPFGYRQHLQRRQLTNTNNTNGDNSVSIRLRTFVTK